MTSIIVLDSPQIEIATSVIVSIGYCDLDAYELPCGGKRMGIGGSSIAIGHTERWFYNRTERPSKWLDELRSKGFTGAQKEVKVLRSDKSGSSIAKTIGLGDFTKLVAHEALSSGNKKAVALLAAFAEFGVEKLVDDAFKGKATDAILDKIVHYTKWTYDEFEQVLAENRSDAKSLRFY